MAKIDKLIINSAFAEPKSHWKYSHQLQSFIEESGRRPAGYFISGQGSNQYNDIGQFIELPLVILIRAKVKKWRENNYAGVTGITKRLLEHWNNNSARQYPFFFCQLDAIETLIWLVEAPESEKIGINIQGDGGDFKRICTKLCTGGGKTTVMAMLIAWQILNKLTYRLDKRFSSNIFIVAPNLTVKSRLQVLLPAGDNSYYKKFNIVPNSLLDKLYNGKVLINNWQALAWDSEEQIKKRKSVDKRGAKSDEAYTKEVLGSMANAQNILVINDEAHHAWRKNPEIKYKRDDKDAVQEATIWIGGLDRIHKTRNILSCYDFSATPFAPSGKKNDEDALFSWIVSDFGLNDGIESGLVKTPRIVVRDDSIPNAQSYKSKLYHIYAEEEVKDNINRPAAKEEGLPDLLVNAYTILGRDWLETYKDWQENKIKVPPVMITVANRTETAARIKYAFDHKRIPINELCEQEYSLHIDSKTLEEAEEIDISNIVIQEENEEFIPKKSKKEIALEMRLKVDTVGQTGKIGEQIRNVISVGMLSEGWDAKTVTHIMGLRAFSSQLLCEQVIGRGLRRTSYDLEEGSELFSAEYVNIFGIPFTFLPHEEENANPKPTSPKTQIEALKDKVDYQISWFNIIRLDREYKSTLILDIDNIELLTLNAAGTIIKAELAPVVDGKTDFQKLSEIDLEKLEQKLRMQTIIFETAAQLYEVCNADWQKKYTKLALFGQIVKLIEEFLSSNKIKIEPENIKSNEIKKRLILMLNMNRIIQHIWNYIKCEYTEKVVPIFDSNKKILSTADMPTWFTSKPNSITQKSHISHCVFDSTWEASESYKLEKNPKVLAWAKNDHLGFEVYYVYEGVIRKYYPDFLIKLKNGITLILETKGQISNKEESKKQALKTWVTAVNNYIDEHAITEFGHFACETSYNIADVDGIIDEFCE